MKIRCGKFRFKPIEKEGIKKRLEFISNEENLKVTDETINQIIEVSEGDMRKAITFLQTSR
jgi:replication factor C subunit 2/4